MRRHSSIINAPTQAKTRKAVASIACLFMTKSATYAHFDFPEDSAMPMSVRALGREIYFDSFLACHVAYAFSSFTFTGGRILLIYYCLRTATVST